MNDDEIVYYVDKHGDKIKKILLNEFNFSKRLIKKIEDEGNIFLNDKMVKSDKNTYEGDVLRIEFEDEENIYEEGCQDVEVLFENRDFLAVNKPPYMITHPSKFIRKDTLANGIVRYYKLKNIKRKIRFINRLDMNTSGVVLIAKNSYAHSRIMDQMNENKVAKKYIALVKGSLEKEEGTVDKSIGLEENEKIKRSINKKGKYAITNYKLVEKYKYNVSFVELELLTGRTHQIRVHMASIENPVLGDVLYGEKSEFIDRQALHCSEMTFKDIRNGNTISVKAQVPEDFLKIMDNRI